MSKFLYLSVFFSRLRNLLICLKTQFPNYLISFKAISKNVIKILTCNGNPSVASQNEYHKQNLNKNKNLSFYSIYSFSLPLSVVFFRSLRLSSQLCFGKNLANESIQTKIKNGNSLPTKFLSFK